MPLEKTNTVKYWHLNIGTLTSYWVFLESLKFGRALDIFGDLQNTTSTKLRP